MILEKVYDNKAENLYCSPSAHKNGEKDGTCFTHKELKLLANEFNKSPTRKTKIKGKTKAELTIGLLNAYKEVCQKHQFCWIKKTLTDSEKIKEFESKFRIKKPQSWNKDHNTWLNTYDILYVCKQYELLHKDYVFLNVVPIDFAKYNGFGHCIGDMLCDFHIQKNILDQGKKRFGIVFNTDPSYLSGAHWQSLYCNLNPRKPNFGIYFYDSVGSSDQSEIPPEVVTFMKKIKSQVEESIKTKKPFEVKYNTIQKQFSNYDCGVYSIVFQTQMLKGVAFGEICKRMKHDKDVNKMRDILYRPST